MLSPLDIALYTSLTQLGWCVLEGYTSHRSWQNHLNNNNEIGVTRFIPWPSWTWTSRCSPFSLLNIAPMTNFVDDFSNPVIK